MYLNSKFLSNGGQTWSACWIWDRDITCGWEKNPELGRGRAGAVVAAVGRWIDREWTGGNPWVTGAARGATRLGLTAGSGSLRSIDEPQASHGAGGGAGGTKSRIWSPDIVLFTAPLVLGGLGVAVTLCRTSGRAAWRPARPQ